MTRTIAVTAFRQDILWSPIGLEKRPYLFEFFIFIWNCGALKMHSIPDLAVNSYIGAAHGYHLLPAFSLLSVRSYHMENDRLITAWWIIPPRRNALGYVHQQVAAHVQLHPSIPSIIAGCIFLPTHYAARGNVKYVYFNMLGALMYSLLLIKVFYLWFMEMDRDGGLLQCTGT